MIDDARLAGLYRYWSDKRGGRAMPSRADLDPLELPGAIWPHIMLLDVVDGEGGPRFRYRRVGAQFWAAAQGDPTGKFLDEALIATAGYRDYVNGLYGEMVRHRVPLYSASLLRLRGQVRPLLIRRVSLPLSSDGVVVNMALAGHVFDGPDLPLDSAVELVEGHEEVARAALA